MNQLQKLKRIEPVDYYSVFNKDGKKICDVATLEDVKMMCSFDQSRTYKKVKVLVDQIVNIPYFKMEDDKQLNPQNILPDRTAEPFVV